MTGVASLSRIAALPMPPRVFRTAESWRDKPRRRPISASKAACETKVMQLAARARPNAPNIGR